MVPAQLCANNCHVLCKLVHSGVLFCEFKWLTVYNMNNEMVVSPSILCRTLNESKNILKFSWNLVSSSTSSIFILNLSLFSNASWTHLHLHTCWLPNLHLETKQSQLSFKIKCYHVHTLRTHSIRISNGTDIALLNVNHLVQSTWMVWTLIRHELAMYK
jgi:hypothetical protein